MTSLLAALGLILIGALLAALCGRRRPQLAQRYGQMGAITGCLLGLASAIQVLISGHGVELLLSWGMPGGDIHLGIDLLSAFFLLPVFGIGLLCAIYGRTYLEQHGDIRSPAVLWIYFNLLILSMALVVTARDGLLFLLAWEVMAISPFFLVIYEDNRAESRHAAWIYLIASHLGTGFLLVMFVLLGNLAGSSNFAAWPAALSAQPAYIPVIFTLAVIGFGAKAGFVPMHVWLPEAHPAAPSHVSALMSGVMIKTGIYGIIRIMDLLGPPQAWWAWVLIAIGAASGVLGVIFALAQHNLKRLLAYHSVENIGIIMLGLGIGTLGLALQQPLIATLGIAGGLLHVLNHSLFKSLLFLGAGAIQVGARTLDIEAMGGLLKRMPLSGLGFFIGAAAIVGLPPLNGFVSEFLIFITGFSAVASSHSGMATGGIVTLAALGLISGLAAACFVKATGVAWLGAPRSSTAAEAREVPALMTVPMLILAGLCLLIGLVGPVVITGMAPLTAHVAGLEGRLTALALTGMAHSLGLALVAFAAVATLVAAIWFWRDRRLAVQGRRRAPTWGCAYPYASPRMQYTASSFADPLNRQFGTLMHVTHRDTPAQGLFPLTAGLHTEADDPFHHLLFLPGFRWLERLFRRAEIIQRGHTHVYVMYVALTLLVVLSVSILSL